MFLRDLFQFAKLQCRTAKFATRCLPTSESQAFTSHRKASVYIGFCMWRSILKNFEWPAIGGVKANSTPRACPTYLGASEIPFRADVRFDARFAIMETPAMLRAYSTDLRMCAAKATHAGATCRTVGEVCKTSIAIIQTFVMPFSWYLGSTAKCGAVEFRISRWQGIEVTAAPHFAVLSSLMNHLLGVGE